MLENSGSIEGQNRAPDSNHEKKVRIYHTKEKKSKANQNIIKNLFLQK